MLEKIKLAIVPLIEAQDCYLDDLVYEKEAGEMYLRVYIEKNGDNLDMDTCVAVSEAVSEKLDEIDVIKDEYYLEVSSPGIEKPLRTWEKVVENVDSYVHIDFKDPKDVEQALNHPNWSMGAKITIDSATLFNKGLEVMEAKWLFDVDYDDIEVLIHPESVLHSAVEFSDTAVIGQMGTPDMRLPIQYALTYPNRCDLKAERLSLSDIGTLHFRKPDTARFPALKLAYEAGRTGGSMPCVLNAANEVANLLFREGHIKFLEIVDLVKDAMDHHEVVENPSLDELLLIDQKTRAYVKQKAGVA